MGYVLVRHGDGAFVSKEGSRASYTTNILQAKVFPTKEIADRNKCGNETARSIDSFF
jgi:hypothetical protein